MFFSFFFFFCFFKIKDSVQTCAGLSHQYRHKINKIKLSGTLLNCSQWGMKQNQIAVRSRVRDMKVIPLPVGNGSSTRHPPIPTVLIWPASPPSLDQDPVTHEEGVIIDFVECCFKNRARAGRGRGAGRLCLTFTSDCSSSLKWWSEEFF